MFGDLAANLEKDNSDRQFLLDFRKNKMKDCKIYDENEHLTKSSYSRKKEADTYRVEILNDKTDTMFRFIIPENKKEFSEHKNTQKVTYPVPKRNYNSKISTYLIL